jgi:hypothetical protein
MCCVPWCVHIGEPNIGGTWVWVLGFTLRPNARLSFRRCYCRPCQPCLWFRASAGFFARRPFGLILREPRGARRRVILCDHRPLGDADGRDTPSITWTGYVSLFECLYLSFHYAKSCARVCLTSFYSRLQGLRRICFGEWMDRWASRWSFPVCCRRMDIAI